MVEVSLQLQQKQILSQKQQQSVAILQMNALALFEYAKEMTEENPLLEWREEAEGTKEEKLLQKLEWLEEADEQNRSMYRTEHEADEVERFGGKEGESLREYLMFQINTMDIPRGHKAVLRFLAESTAESGYLEKDALSVMMEKYPMKESTAARILKEFQSLDPVGVGARDLQECLLIQLRQRGASALAVKLVERYLNEVAKNRLSHIAKEEKISPEAVAEALQEVRSCNPKPGSGFAGEGPVEYVIPDIFVEQEEGELTVMVNGSVVPHLNISHNYVQMLRKGADGETEAYISEKLKQAEWALQCIHRRENTLQQVAECILRRQTGFFKGGQLAPLRLVDVAEELGIHESTVSRALKEKYLQCDRGVFPLSHFFSKAMSKVEMEGAVSAESIKERLKAIIKEENRKKPFSDRELTERLNAEGIQISRRTVAKYREGMGIAGAAGRKSF